MMTLAMVIPSLPLPSMIQPGVHVWRDGKPVEFKHWNEVSQSETGAQEMWLRARAS